MEYERARSSADGAQKQVMSLFKNIDENSLSAKIEELKNECLRSMQEALEYYDENIASLYFFFHKIY